MAKRNYGKLDALNKIVPCKNCGKLTHSSIDGCVGICLCRKCYEEAGMENEHLDGHHDEQPMKGCPCCEKGVEDDGKTTHRET